LWEDKFLLRQIFLLLRVEKESPLENLYLRGNLAPLAAAPLRAPLPL
jgi:hypothetical protein